MQPTITTKIAAAAPAPEPKPQPRRKLHLKFQSPLTPTEEVSLTGRNYDPAIRNRLVESFLPLVEEIARYYANFGRDVDELIGEGNLALCEAATQYNYLSCRPFLDYAADRVRKAIYRLFGVDGASPRTPAAVRTELGKLDAVELQLYQKLGHRPTNAEIAPYLAATPAYVGELRLLQRKLNSLNQPAKVGSEGSSDLIELVPDSGYQYRDEAEDTVDRAEVDILLQRDVLTEEERKCLIHAYGLCGNPDLTYREVGKLMGFSHTTVGNRVTSAIRKLSLLPRLRPTWVKGKLKYTDDVQPVVKLDTCAQCGKHIFGWGNRTFHDWGQYRQPAKETPAGTVPHLTVCYRCSLTVTFAERIQLNLAARGAMLAVSEAIRVNVWDYKTNKLVSLATYAPAKPAKPAATIEHQPLRCCYCPTIISTDTLGDVVVKEVSSYGLYQLVGCCKACYQKVEAKWEQGKHMKHLVREPEDEVEFIVAKPKRKHRGPSVDRITVISRYWQREARKLAIIPQPPAPSPDDWDYGWRTNTILDPLGQSLGYCSPTLRLSRAQLRLERRLEAEAVIAELPYAVRRDLAEKRRLETARAEQMQLYRQLLKDEDIQVTACILLATEGSFTAQVLAHRFLARAGNAWRVADSSNPATSTDTAGTTAAEAAPSRMAKCNKCRTVTTLRRLNLGPRTNRTGSSYHYAVGLCANCWPKSPAEVHQLQVR